MSRKSILLTLRVFILILHTVIDRSTGCAPAVCALTGGVPAPLKEELCPLHYRVAISTSASPSIRNWQS